MSALELHQTAAIQQESKEKPSVSIHIEVFRHGERQKEPAEHPEREPHLGLTNEGRTQSEIAGKRKHLILSNASIRTSHRTRAAESGLQQMLANEPQEEVTNPATRERFTKPKIISLTPDKFSYTENLNYQNTHNREFYDAYKPHYSTKNAISFIFHQSDDLVVKFLDDKDYSYTRMAGHMAELIKESIQTLPKIKQDIENDAIAPEENNTYEKQELWPTHGTVPESFILKVISKVESPEAAEKFISKFPDGNGFANDEGFSMIITEDETTRAPLINISCLGSNWKITEDILDEIIQEKNDLLTHITEKKQDESA